MGREERNSSMQGEGEVKIDLIKSVSQNMH